jgi:hypothetical protein
MANKAEELATRLERGWQMIEQEKSPARKEKLTDQWIAMLKQYEAVAEHS